MNIGKKGPPLTSVCFLVGSLLAPILFIEQWKVSVLNETPKKKHCTFFTTALSCVFLPHTLVLFFVKKGGKMHHCHAFFYSCIKFSCFL